MASVSYLSTTCQGIERGSSGTPLLLTYLCKYDKSYRHRGIRQRTGMTHVSNLRADLLHHEGC